MTKFDLFDSIGNVDDELIEKAVKPKMNSTNMRLFLITGSIAACAVIAVTVVFLTSGNNTTLEKKTFLPSVVTRKRVLKYHQISQPEELIQKYRIRRNRMILTLRSSLQISSM